jgi:hypothetical protein
MSLTTLLLGKMITRSVCDRKLMLHCRGGTSGSAVSARLSEDPNVKILLLEAGGDSAEVDNVHMAGA